MKPRKKKKKKSGSLLSQLFGGKKKGKSRKRGRTSGSKKVADAGGKKVSETASAGGDAASGVRPMTRLERSIAEIRQMTRIGRKDPERLARLLTTLLAKEREKQQADKAEFDALVWEIVHRNEEKEGSGSPPPESS